MEFLENGLRKDDEILHAYRRQSDLTFGTLAVIVHTTRPSPQLTNMTEITSLDALGRLQNAIKYCIKVRKTAPAKMSNNSATV